MKIDLSLMPPSKDEIEGELKSLNDSAKRAGKNIKATLLASVVIIMAFNIFMGSKFGNDHFSLLLLSSFLYGAWLLLSTIPGDDLDKFWRNGVYLFALILLTEYGDKFVAIIVAVFYVAMLLMFSLTVSLIEDKRNYKNKAGGLNYIESYYCEYVLNLKKQYPLIDSYMKNIQQIGRKVTHVEVRAMSEHESSEKIRIEKEKEEAACKELYFGEIMAEK